MVHPGKSRSTHHTVRFTGDEMPKYKPIVSDSTDSPNYVSSQSYPGQDSGAPSPEAFNFQPAAQRYRHNEQSKSMSSQLMALKQANQRLEKEKFNIVSEIEHLKRHLEKEEAHHLQHARTAVAQAIQGMVTKCPVSDSMFSQCSVADLPNVVSRSVAKNAPSRNADNKLAAARLMRDIAELRQRVAQVEARLANELKRKRQAELDIIRLRKELSSTKSFVASLRMPPLRKQCSKFA
ncbi:uncharacterized protein LOC118278446 [Spodoptera frugiperda]|uniref:Uncharacterized protein LOC118278446 n=1 Tax=Spodoptera frugiperda TaxID=7108 RepID=A0A9R0F3L5_SPOFR|nr:uncharacterized protein LOC118278446 [Spodoptera frugiperda]